MLNRQDKREIINKFGNFFVTLGRDWTLSAIQIALSGIWKNEGHKKLASLFSELSEENQKFVGELLPEVVDKTMEKILSLFEQHCPSISKSNNCTIQLIYSEKGEYYDINELSDGLVDELYTNDSWITKFSSYGNFIEL
ncbi:MAG: hypothetical protein LBE12_19575 [Planctomycetaceae bacterium]|jgi:hypothetical protein|nr:hypothetical protein [Planctomycetaceae bacterium]